MIRHSEIDRNTLRRLVHAGKIKFGGYRPGKIYGTLHCPSGKRMKTENRVFFESEQEAIDAGYRPCGHCMPEQYQRWKAGRARLRQQ
ncbi:Ada metal-binding domain-containing protein [Chitinophaga cymbidii]|uniref:Ada metal-binding domain-containing protein n=1 Tax=Chitinophaga cymbidii TaxID=1096750 RepID=UPI0011BEB577|nr:Ada metal-binding domain-containing protein [Chitinophaga cymbidii]